MAAMVLASLAALSAEGGAGVFDHAAFDALLRAHVRDGLVDYDAFRDAPSFAAYLAALDRARPEALGQAEQIAFWINAYNACTIQLVAAHGERESIRNINKTLGLFAGKGPWQEPLVRAGGRRLTLDEVEHEILRRRFHEPRVHFALVCAALSCPPLRAEAYTGARLEQQLDAQARAFLLETPAANRVDPQTRTFHASRIFDWYRDDFGGSHAALGRYLARFYPEGPQRALLQEGAFRIEWTEYDWRLNRRGPGTPR